MATKLSRVLITVLLSACCAATVRAATSEQAGSILIFPHVVADAQHDTIFQIVNRSYLKAHAKCVYVRVAGETVAEADWSIELEPKQTTHWSTARGRPLDPNDPVCFGDGTMVVQSKCDGAGFDPGEVPPTVDDFSGEMICVQTDASGAPASGNALSGVADVINTTDGSAARYAAFGLRGLDDNNNDGELCVGQAGSETCSAAEYEACPSRWMLVHPSEGEEDDGSETATTLIVAACAQDLLSHNAQKIDLELFVINEFEQRFRLVASVDGAESISLSEFHQVFHRDIGGELLLTDLVSSDGRGFVVLSQIDRSDANGRASLANNLYGDPTHLGADTIRVPQ